MATCNAWAARSKIPTPNIDRLAASGMIFTDAHSGSSVCTPTRYGILTGRYAWRTRLQAGVLNGYSPPLIAAGRLTVPALLKKHGYETACMGKWHLGLEISRSPRELAVKEGPTARGFDYFFGVSASLDMPPFAYIENDRITQAPTATKKFLREGPAAPDFEAVDVLPALTRKAVEYIRRRAADKKPFFLYLALDFAAYAHRADERVAGPQRLEQVRRFRHADRLDHRPGVRTRSRRPAWTRRRS